MIDCGTEDVWGNMKTQRCILYRRYPRLVTAVVLIGLYVHNSTKTQEILGLRQLHYSLWAELEQWWSSATVPLSNVSSEAFLPISPYQQSTSKHRLSNINLAFLGDSVTRYQYLSLVYFVHTGVWFKDREKLNIVNEWAFDDWNHFFNYSTVIFDNQLKCDCYRPPHYIRNMHLAYENRYYADPTNNVYLTFIQKWGHVDARGHLDPKVVYDEGTSAYSLELSSNAEPLWVFNWTELIRNHIAKLHPKPNYLILNAGLWKNNFHDIAHLQNIRQALEDVNIVGIYKTTSRQRDDRNPSPFENDLKACQVFQYCFEITNFTGSLTKDSYWDRTHLLADANRKLNEMLLEFLTHVQTVENKAGTQPRSSQLQQLSSDFL